MRRVLVVEPDDDRREQYAQSLQRAGCEVIEASDGRDALVKALARAPTLVLTETHLPMFDGYALCEVLRRDTTTRSVPVLLVTTETESVAVERARKAGANAILIKPASIEEILREIERLLTPVKPPRTGSVNSPATATLDVRPPACVQLLSVAPQGIALSKAHRRFETTTPPTQPPSLLCPSCGRQLTYKYSRIGGVSDRHSEQWDEYACPAACGIFQYRHRTRILRRVVNV